VVSEGRARALDAVNVRDRATYGLDWLVVYASSTRDAVHQWGLYKAGTHPTQDKLELEVARYRSAPAEYLPSWEAEADLVTRDVDESIESVAARQRELEEVRAGSSGCARSSRA
jgi:hypothetical protein